MLRDRGIFAYPSKLKDAVSGIARTFAFACVLGTLAGCHPTLATVRFTSPGDSWASVNLSPDATVRFWSDLDVEWDEGGAGDLQMTYAIELRQDGVVVGTSTCDATRISSSFGGKVCGARIKLPHELMLNCLMHDCELHVPRGGLTVVRARFNVRSAPPGFTITRAHVLVSE